MPHTSAPTAATATTATAATPSRTPSHRLATVERRARCSTTTANREMRNLHSSVRAVFAEWLIDGLGAAGVPATQPVRASVAG